MARARPSAQNCSRRAVQFSSVQSSSVQFSSAQLRSVQFSSARLGSALPLAAPLARNSRPSVALVACEQSWTRRHDGFIGPQTGACQKWPPPFALAALALPRPPSPGRSGRPVAQAAARPLRAAAEDSPPAAPPRTAHWRPLQQETSVAPARMGAAARRRRESRADSAAQPRSSATINQDYLARRQQVGQTEPSGRIELGGAR